MPGYQGKYDGLCGMYAIVNAYEICEYNTPDDEVEEEIFHVACSALASNRWPSVLWEGTTLGDLRKMIARCQEWLLENEFPIEIKVAYPFLRNTPRTNEDYWEKLFDIFEDESVYCAIVGMEGGPVGHWIVVEFDRQGRLLFSDSEDGGMRRVSVDEIHAGERKPGWKDYKFSRKELIVFSVASVE